ncbi:hypothetical protein [Pyruvatibacter sp.]
MTPEQLMAVRAPKNGKPATGYYYLHENGEVIFKSTFVVEQDPLGPHGYFDSPFVHDWVWVNGLGDIT